MKNLMFAVLLGSIVTTIMAQSGSISCSSINGKWSCREMNNPNGDSAFSSSVALSGPGGDSTFEGVGTGSNDRFNWDQGGTGIFSGVNPPGGSETFPFVNPFGGSETFPFGNPFGGTGIFSGMNPSGVAGIFSGVNPSDGTSESEDYPLSDADDPSADPEVTEQPIVNPPTGGSNFVPLPMVPSGTFATAGSAAFPAVINRFGGAGAVAGFPFGGAGAVAGFPFGGRRAFAGAPFINRVMYPGFRRFPRGYPFGRARALAYAGKRK